MIEAAKKAGHEGKFAIHLTNTTGQPPLDSLQNRAVRERVMAASLARGSRGGGDQLGLDADEHLGERGWHERLVEFRNVGAGLFEVF